ncbi:MAG: L,D-transpeptidase family protein [Henriciella sp.]|nr:L,D-transpeptidase family protein [Henriciella sp.]MBO6695267.1 L,D-transpeptidase family protein [Henriciella sp.]
MSQKGEQRVTDLTFTASARGKFSGNGLTCQCALGRGGVVVADQKREGDGTSPQGIWRMNRVFYRPDRLARPDTALPVVPLREIDGWCDAPEHPLYNRAVTLPFEASHEKLWREDHVYDLIVELSHNSDPVIPALGSAVFFHLAHDDYRQTEGCVAILREHMLQTLKVSDTKTSIEISF